MNKGDIVLVEFPYTDFSGTKVRPALTLAVRDDDVLIAFITSRNDNVTEDDLLIEADSENKLKRNSVLRLFKLATIENKRVIGKIGSLNPDHIQKVDATLIKILKIKI